MKWKTLTFTLFNNLFEYLINIYSRCIYVFYMLNRRAQFNVSNVYIVLSKIERNFAIGDGRRFGMGGAKPQGVCGTGVLQRGQGVDPQ